MPAGAAHARISCLQVPRSHLPYAVQVGVYLLTLVLLGVQTLQECLAIIDSSHLREPHDLHHAVLWKLRMYLRAVAAGRPDLRRTLCPAYVAEAAFDTELANIFDFLEPTVRRARPRAFMVQDLLFGTAHLPSSGAHANVYSCNPLRSESGITKPPVCASQHSPEQDNSSTQTSTAVPRKAKNRKSRADAKPEPAYTAEAAAAAAAALVLEEEQAAAAAQQAKLQQGAKKARQKQRKQVRCQPELCLLC